MWRVRRGDDRGLALRVRVGTGSAPVTAAGAVWGPVPLQGGDVSRVHPTPPHRAAAAPGNGHAVRAHPGGVPVTRQAGGAGQASPAGGGQASPHSASRASL